MNQETLIERLFQSLVSGNRVEARSLVTEAMSLEYDAETLSKHVYWPVMEMIASLYRADQITTLAHHYGTRLLRTLVDQAQANYRQKERRNRTVCMFCGPTESDELSAQLVADLAEADGYTVYFAGGGIANDEILAEVGERRPDVLLMFSSGAADAPQIRQLIDTIREIQATPNMQIVVGGGIFNRAPGLAEEIGADLWAASPQDLLEQLVSGRERRASSQQRTVGRMKKPTRRAA
ncbi:MAG: cobalamin-dependent protein [Phycisphaerales bacterium]|nr:cobalamin-dependent protein [Phycisphaerales bacterium]